MNYKLIRKFCFIISLLSVLLLPGCDTRPEKHNSADISIDLDKIRERGRLVAVTDYNSVNYFLYKGEPMGLHYELLKNFSEHLNLELEIITENNLEKAFGMLNSGEVDLLAIGLTVNESRRKELQFTEPFDETRQVLVQRKPHSWRNMPLAKVENGLVRNNSGLAGKTIYVQEGSSHVDGLSSIAASTGIQFNIVEVPFETEVLVSMVEQGEIGYAVCDENIALVNATYYPDIDVSTPLSPPQSLAWAIRKNNSRLLLNELDTWIRSYRKSDEYAILYAKYFRNTRSEKIVRSDYFALRTGKVSPWDDIIKIYSESIKWDWRLLAALICQESRFLPDVISVSGAYGLMQIMPETGKNFGVDIMASPKNNILAGTKYITWLHSIFDTRIPDENERYRFILASYNAGPGHILDAMALAEKNGKDPRKWKDNVADFLLKKSEPQYYNDSVVKNGYFRGKQSVAFVDEVLERYEHYKNIIPPEER